MKVIMHDGSVQEFTFEDEIGRNALRHTASHILAQAVKRLFPETKLAIGPAIKEGFYLRCQMASLYLRGVPLRHPCS